MCIRDSPYPRHPVKGQRGEVTIERALGVVGNGPAQPGYELGEVLLADPPGDTFCLRRSQSIREGLELDGHVVWQLARAGGDLQPELAVEILELGRARPHQGPPDIDRDVLAPKRLIRRAGNLSRADEQVLVAVEQPGHLPALGQLHRLAGGRGGDE